MSTATPASADVRTPPTDRAADLERQLHETRTEARLLRAQSALRRLKESAALDYDWYGPWSEVQRQRDGDRAWVPINGTHGRRYGHYFPFFQNETQLATLRDLSRVVVGTNNHASGMLNGLTSFVIGTGFKLKVTPTNGDKRLAQKVTDWFDGWAAANYWDEFQQEAFGRHREDGDAIIRMFPDDGCLKLRHVWAEQLTQPPGTTVEEYGYGVRMPKDDEAAPEPEAYWLADLDNPAVGEEVPACEVIHLKANTRTGVKRGLPDFSFGTKDALDAAGRLTRNLGEGAAIREAIAFMRQHGAASEADVQAFVAADADFREREPTRESYRPVNVWAPGTVVDFPEGMEHAGAPANPGTSAHTAVVQLLLRSAGVKWNAPEWLISGDASNMGAFTSSLVAESPFVRSVLRAQGYYRERFLRIVRKALWLALASGYLPGDALTACKVELVPPSPEVRNKLEEVQRAQIEINLGTDSRQRVAEEQGRDWEKVAKENQEYQDQFGAPGGELPLDGDRGGGGGDSADVRTPPDQPPDQPPDGPTALDGTPLPESDVGATGAHRDLFEQIEALLGEEGGDGPAVRWFRFGGLTYRVDIDLLEAAGNQKAPAGKVWKTITFTRNGKQVKQQRLVNAPQAAAGAQKGAAKKPTPKQAAAAKAVTAVSAAQKKLAAGGALTPAALAALPGHLQTLTLAQLKQVATNLKVKGAKVKAGMVSALVAHATAQTQNVTAAKAAAKGPSKAQQTATAKAASLTAATAAFATIKAGGSLSASDLAALPGHLNNLTTAQLVALRRTHAGYLTGDKTKAGRVARLAQWAARMSAGRQSASSTPPPVAVAASQQPAGPTVAGAAAVPASRQPGAPPTPGFTGVDTNGHHWVNGKQVTAPPDETHWETGKPQPGTSLNGVAFASAPPKFWEKTPDKDIGEPKPLKKIDRVSVMIQEPDGRVWIVQPTNGFGNRKFTLAGGGVEPGLSNQQNALKEVWEETGLQVEITGHLGDFEDSNNGNNGRLYIGRRVGGAPWDAKVESFIRSNKTGQPAAESEAVSLVTLEKAAQLLHRTDDLAQLMVVHPPKIDTPTSGKGSEPIKKLVAALAPKARAYDEKQRQAGVTYGPGNGELHAIQELRGYNKKPRVVAKTDMDALIAKGDHIELLRGVKDVAGVATARQLADQYRSGGHFPGHGIFGSGTYADSNKGAGNVAAQYGRGGAVMRMALPKTAKIIKASELERLVPAAPAGFVGYSGKGGKSRDECWLGVQAAIAGYDAIEVDGKSRRHGSYGKGFYVILNRSIVTVQQEDATGHVIK
jgi:8-oxo-dGTP pyrophosphatase MutT (NUDIX family)